MEKKYNEQKICTYNTIKENKLISQKFTKTKEELNLTNEAKEE